LNPAARGSPGANLYNLAPPRREAAVFG